MEHTEMIAELSRIIPPYASNFKKEFLPGKTQVLYSGPYWDSREMEMALKSLLTGNWITAGEYVIRFQNIFAKHFKVKHAHMVNSGSSANLVMVAALKKYHKWDDGDEIIVSPVGFPTTIAPLVQNNLRPVFVDIETDTLNFDLRLIQEKITPRTKAILVSPVLGNPPDMGVLKSICDYHNIMLVGDNCDSLGTKWDEKYLNEMYVAWSTSFYPAHHITTGEGGMVCSNDSKFIDLCRSMSWWGRDCYCVGKANLLPCGTCGKRFDTWLDGVDATIDHKYIFSSMGYNLKPLDLQGAIGIAQMEKIDDIERLRRENFCKIKNILSMIPEIRVASSFPEADPCWFGVPIICSTQGYKESLVAHLESKKIQTRSYFAGNILQHPGYRHLDKPNNFPKANTALTHVFFIGCPPHYNDTIIEYIREALSTWIR